MRQRKWSIMARAVIGCWREPMQLWERVAPLVVPLLIIIAITDVGYFVKDLGHARHLVFLYLLPTAFVAMIYGSVLSMIFAIYATLVAQFFFYDPPYTLLYVSSPRQAGELIVFAVTALIGAKCMAELTSQPKKHF